MICARKQHYPIDSEYSSNSNRPAEIKRKKKKDFFLPQDKVKLIYLDVGCQNWYHFLSLYFNIIS